MSIAQRGSATFDDADAGDKTSLVLTKPTGTVEGDVLIALWTANGVSVTPPSGFTEVVSQIGASSALTTKFFYKVAGGSEPSSYTFNCGSGPVCCMLTAWSGADNVNPIGTNYTSSGGSGVAEGATTPTTNNDAQAGRTFYWRSALIGASPSVTFAGPGGSVAEVAENACDRAGTCRSQALYSDTSDFSGGGATKTGATITATGTETSNTYGTFVLRAHRSTTDYGASIDVFQGGVTLEPGVGTAYANVRIPAIVRTPAGTLIAFAEGRVAVGDYGDIDIIARRSTDGGANWGSVFKVKENGTQTAGNPVPLINNAGDVILAYTKEGPQGGANRYPQVTKSTDDGVTWGTTTDLTSIKPANWGWFATGPGHGIRTQSGRLIVPIHGDHSTLADQAGCMYSDDDGTTWATSTTFATNTGGTNDFDEGTIAELPDGTLVLFSRNQDSSGPDRLRSISTDGGITWGSTTDSTMVSTAVQGSVIQHKDRLIFSGSDDPTNRNNMVLRQSTDGGNTWSLLQTVYRVEDAAYSDMCITSGNSVGIIYERGTANAYEYNTFVRVPLADITQVGTATSGGVSADSTSVTADKPTGVAANDVLIAVLTSNSVSITPPSGWTLFDSDNSGVLYTKLYYKVAGGSEGADYTWTCAAAPIQVSIAAFRGCDTAAPIVNSSSSTNSGSASEPVTTPEMANDSTNGRMFYVRSSYIASATPITFASTAFVEEIVENSQTTTGNTTRSQVLYAWNHGFEGTADIKSGIAITATGTEVDNTMFTFALKAATRMDTYWDYSVARASVNAPKSSVGAKVHGIG